ncbi:MAG: hypothetical protein RMJ07_01455 [Nitrososphaerota archaeon]|nr:hypothetical protein [Candidatus Bathyarchaeota archaeon]MDW8048337.1 hypothetical protein [Nitrososphaerota archaeon]
MSDIDEKIEECIAEIGRYREYSPEIEVRIDQLRKLKEALKNIDDSSLKDLLTKVRDGYEESLHYSGFIPKTVRNLRFILEWLEKKKECSHMP